MPPSRRLQALAVLFLVLLAGSLVFASAPAPAWRALAGLCTGLLLWPSMRALVFQRGPRAVRRLSWAPDGRWFIVLGDGIEQEVFLHPSSAALGPCLMLAWTSTPGPLARRCYALIDGASVSPVTFRALRGRLKLARIARRERHEPSGSPLN